MIIKKVEEHGTSVTVTFEEDVILTCDIGRIWVIQAEKPEDVFVKAYDLKPGMEVRLPLA